MQARTVILVTHHLGAVLDSASWIVKMDNGRITAQGTPSQLRATGQLADIIKSEANEVRNQEKTEEVFSEKKTEDDASKPSKKLVEEEKKAT